MDIEGTDRPGREVSKEHRQVIEHLIDSQGWKYELPSGGGYPRLYPADATQSPIRVPKTGRSRGHAFGNWIADIRRKGGQWPPGRVPAEADDDQRGTQKEQRSAEGG